MSTRCGVQVEVSPRSVLVFGLAAVGAIAIASYVRDAIVGAHAPPRPPAAIGFLPNAERDRELRETHPFLGYVQCPVPVPSGVAHLEGEGALTGPFDLVSGFAEFPVFAESGAITLRVPGHHREVVHWSGLGDGSMTSCLPVPDWRPLTPRRVEGRIVNPDASPMKAGHVLACGQFVPVDSDGAFAFDGGIEPCTVEPIQRRAHSSVAGVAAPYDPESSTDAIDLTFVPRAVRLDHWQGQPADVEFVLAPEGLVVAHALAPSKTAGGARFQFVAVPGLPEQARITAVDGEACAEVPAARMIELAEALASAGTSYHIILPGRP